MPPASTLLYCGSWIRAWAAIGLLWPSVLGALPGYSMEWKPTAARPNVLRGAERRLLDRAERYLADEQWSDAVDALMRLIESENQSVVASGEGRYVSLNEYCQQLMTQLPAEPLQANRNLVDRIAERWYREGVEQRDLQQLQKVVDAYFCSSWVDDALLAIGELELQRGNYQTARNAWSRIAVCPAADISLAMTQARLVLVAIREGDWQRASEEVVRFMEQFPDSTGRLGGREVVLADYLHGVLEQARSRSDDRTSSDWRTFAGNPQRTNVTSDLKVDDSYELVWSVSLANEHLEIIPVVVGDVVAYRDSESVRALRLADGQEMFVARNDAVAVVPRATRVLGRADFSITATDRYLFGVQQIPLGVSRQAKFASDPSVLWALDLSRDGAIAFQQSMDDATVSFAGAPLVIDTRVYVSVRSNAQTARAGVACYDLSTGIQVWQSWLCQSNTPTTGATRDIATNLLTYDAGILYANTNLGAVAAIRAEDGRMQWLTTYPRRAAARLEDVAAYYRGPQPCVYHFGRVFVVPTDSYTLLTLDAGTGEVLWKYSVSDPHARLIRVDGQGVVVDNHGLRCLDPRSGELIDKPNQNPLDASTQLPDAMNANFAYAESYVVAAGRDRLSVFIRSQLSSEQSNHSLTSSNE